MSIDPKSMAGILLRELGPEQALAYAEKMAARVADPVMAADYANAAQQIKEAKE